MLFVQPLITCLENRIYDRENHRYTNLFKTGMPISKYVIFLIATLKKKNGNSSNCHRNTVMK